MRNSDFELTIGIVVPSFYNIFFAEVVHGIEDYLNYDARSLILNRSQGNAQDEMNCINDLLERNVSGIIVISPNMSGINENFYEKISRQVPLIFINGYRKISGAYYVKNQGLKFDISIISFDNIFLSRIVDPKLTTMDQNMFKLGYTTATIL